MIIRLTKIATITPEGDPGNFVTGFWVVGKMVDEPRPGSPLYVDNPTWSTQKKGETWARFSTSYVERVEGDIIHTRNAVYRLETNIKPAQ